MISPYPRVTRQQRSTELESCVATADVGSHQLLLKLVKVGVYRCRIVVSRQGLKVPLWFVCSDMCIYK